VGRELDWGVVGDGWFVQSVGWGMGVGVSGGRRRYQ
jgi:hypothetical protein